MKSLARWRESYRADTKKTKHKARKALISRNISVSHDRCFFLCLIDIFFSFPCIRAPPTHISTNFKIEVSGGSYEKNFKKTKKIFET